MFSLEMHLPYFHGKVKGRNADISEYTREEEKHSETHSAQFSFCPAGDACQEGMPAAIQSRLAHSLIHSHPVSGSFQVFLELCTVPMDTV